MTDTEELVDLGVDLNAPVPCEAEYDGPCFRSAEWAVLNPCCGYTKLACDPHKIQSAAAVLVLRALTPVGCVRCGAKNPDTTWRKL